MLLVSANGLHWAAFAKSIRQNRVVVIVSMSSVPVCEHEIVNMRL
jgi:hypothetical protein